jgi:hypothetical protein
MASHAFAGDRSVTEGHSRAHNAIGGEQCHARWELHIRNNKMVERIAVTIVNPALGVIT